MHVYFIYKEQLKFKEKELDTARKEFREKIGFISVEKYCRSGGGGVRRLQSLQYKVI